MSKVVVEDIQKARNFKVSKSNCTSKTKLYLKNLAYLNPRKHGFVPICAVSALELHALIHYPSYRQNDRQNDRMTDRNTNRLPYAFTAHAHRRITTNAFRTTTVRSI